MAMTGRLEADFASFYDAVQKADVMLRQFEGEAARVESSLQKMVDSFNGREIQSEATLMTEAIERIGGVSKLTKDEMASVNATLTAAIEKFRALGEQAPEAMVQLAEATKQTDNAWEEFIADFDIESAMANPLGTAKNALVALADTMGPTATAALAMGATVVAVGAGLFKLAENAAAAGAALDDMADKTGMSVPALSHLDDAAKVIGSSLPQMADVVYTFQQRMAEGGADFEKGMKAIGASTADVRAAGPDQLLLLLATGLQSIADPTERIAAGNALLGRSYREVAASLNDVARGFELTRDIEPWTAEQAAEAERFEQQLASLKVHAEAFAVSLGQPLIGPLSTFIAGLADGATWLNRWVDLTGGIKGSVDSVSNWFSWAGTAYDVFKGKVQGPIDFAALDEAKRKLQEVRDAAYDAAHAPDVLVQKWKDAATGMQLHVPKGAEVLRLLDTETKELEQATNQTIAAMKPFNEAMVELNSAGATWQDTLNTMSGDVVEAVKYYLDAGVSQTALANAYDLTATQIKAVSAALKEELDAQKVLDDFAKKTHEIAMKQQQEVTAAQKKELDARNTQVVAGFQQIQQLEAQNADFVQKMTLSETDYKIAKIREWEQATINAFKGTTEQVATYTDAVRTRAQQQVDAFSKVNDIVTLIGKSAAERAAEEQGAAKQTGDAVTAEYRRQEEAFMSFKGVVVAGTREILEQSATMQYQMTREIRTASDWIDRQWAMQQAQRDRGEIFLTGFGGGMPTRAGGGPVSPNTTYLVGEQGPELFTPSGSGFISPSGAAGVVIHNTFHVVDTEANIVQRVGEAITRSLKSSTKWGTV